jgi:hypothetical protein
MAEILANVIYRLAFADEREIWKRLSQAARATLQSGCANRRGTTFRQ